MPAIIFTDPSERVGSRGSTLTISVAGGYEFGAIETEAVVWVTAGRRETSCR